MTGVNRNSEASAARPELVVMMMMMRRILMLMFMMVMMIAVMMMTGVNRNSAIKEQTRNLSKKLHRRIFRLKILHRQFHLISTVLVRKNTKN